MKYRVPPVLAVAASALVVPTSTPAVASASAAVVARTQRPKTALAVLKPDICPPCN